MNQRDQEIVKLAAQTGAQFAFEEFAKLQKRDKQEQTDRRLRNVKLLLRNYKTLRLHAENAVFEAESEESPTEIIEDLMSGRDSNLIVDSIKRSAARTSIIIRHIDAMLGLYHTFCFSKHATPEDERRWRVIDALFISDDTRTVAELAEEEKVVERTIYKDIDIACERIAALMFGVDVLDSGQKRRNT